MGLDSLMRAEAVTGAANRTLSIMNRQLDYMVRLIDDLLDVARISGGMLELKRERIDLTTVIENAREMCRPFFEQRRQRLDLRLTDAICVSADPVRLAQVIGNLLHNASKFSPEGGRVELVTSVADGVASISIIDAGLGIAAERLPLVFDMFARTERETRGANSGLGIGLALSRKLAEMHGGELIASSRGVGEGSVFTLSVPAEGGAPEPPAAAPAPKSSSKASARPSVLIIEDNEDSAEVLALWLEDRDCDTRVVHTGEEGLALVPEIRPQFILCDIGLPDIDGVEVCRRVRQLPLDYRPVMAALTGWGMDEDRRRTREAGFDHHFVKPVAPEQLDALLAGAPVGNR
jgi:CheY-like chemotaxis protein